MTPCSHHVTINSGQESFPADEKEVVFPQQFKFPRPNRKVAALLAAALLSAGLVAVGWQRFLNSSRPPLRLGFNNAPPYHFIRPDGSLAGFVLEAIELAAQRQGLRYAWTLNKEP